MFQLRSDGDVVCILLRKGAGTVQDGKTGMHEGS